MSNIVALQTPAPLRSRDYDPAQLSLIRRTVAADTTPDEFNMFIEIAKRAGLDPFRKQLYCIVYSKDNAEKRKVAFITGIDGFRAVAARNGDYRPDDEEPMFVTDDAAKDPETNPQGFVKATVRAFKRHGDEWHPVVGVAYWNEFAPLKEIWEEPPGGGKRRPSGRFEIDKRGNWYRMPHVMLAKCAEAQALRKGWPEDLSGIYSPEEMERPMMDVTPTDAIAQFEQEKRLALVGATRSVPIIWKVGDPIVYVPAGQLYDEAAKHIASVEIAAELKWWRETNSAGIRELWAISKSDGLGINKLYEDRLKALAG